MNTDSKKITAAEWFESFDYKKASFLSTRWYIAVVSEAGPSFEWDGNLVASRASEKTKPSPRLKRQAIGGKVKGIFRAVFGSVDDAIRATVLSVAAAMKAEAKGDIITGATTTYQADAEAFVHARITPEVKEALRFMLLDKASTKKQDAPLSDFAVQVGDRQILLRDNSARLTEDVAALGAAFNQKTDGPCPTCGAVPVKFIDAEAVKLARTEAASAKRTADANARKAARELARVNLKAEAEKEAAKVVKLPVTDLEQVSKPSKKKASK